VPTKAQQTQPAKTTKTVKAEGTPAVTPKPSSMKETPDVGYLIIGTMYRKDN
jgi:hypothetical protein